MLRNKIYLLLCLTPFFFLLKDHASSQNLPEPKIAQPNAAPAASASSNKEQDYSNESYVIQKYSTDVTYAADGTGERIITVKVKVQSDAAVRQFGVLEFPYESRNEHLDFDYVRVHKPDGSVVATSDSDVQDQPAEVTRQAPFYSDIRNKQLPVKSLSVGDVLEYQVHQVRTVAAAPGEFWYTQTFVKDAVVLEETASLNVPKSKYVQVQSDSVKPEILEQGEKKTYRWKTAQLERSKPADDKPRKQPITEIPPSIAVTTFKNWAEVGHWYGELQRDRVSVTPSIKAKADELTKSATSDEAKMEAIYTYVSTQYRYIGVAFGIGRYQPHSADDVMQNQYGDCKDKHTLLAALLKAEGYDAWPVLVGSQHLLDPAFPSPGQFDHLMTAVTIDQAGVKRDLWMDSTPEVAPFRMLFYALRDKLVLVIPTNGTPVLMKTPANPPFEPLDKYNVKATLSSDGTLDGHFDISLRGDSELLYRIGFHQTSRVQWNSLIQNVAYASGFAGTTSNVTAGSPEKLGVPFEISYDYTRKKFSDWDNHRILPLMPPVAFVYSDEDAKPTDTIMLGGPSNIELKTEIKLPPGYTVELPAAVALHSTFGDYATSYSQDGESLIVVRKIHIMPRDIPVTQWDEYLKFEKAVTEDEGTYIQLIGVGAAVPGNRVASNPEASNLIQQAFVDIKAQSYEAARLKLDQAAGLNPTERGLWAGYGYADFSQNRVEDGFEAYRKEIRNHPENAGVYYSLAGMQEIHNQPDESEKTLRSLLLAVPDDVTGRKQLAQFLIRRKRAADAIPVLEESVKLLPGDANLKVMLGAAEVSGGSKEEGAALLRNVLADATDESVLNSAAYHLADANLDLAAAHSGCERALQQLDAAMAKTSLESVTDDDLKNVGHLAAAWDTMGWILYRQGEFSKAQAYARAAWMLDQRPVIGGHLGQIYEKMGKKEDAVRTYKLAVAAGHSGIDPETDDAVHRLADLNAEFDRSQKSALNEELGKLRSVAIHAEQKREMSADFFVLFSRGRVVDERFIKGDSSLKPEGSQLQRVDFDLPFAPDSGASIVRRGIFYCSLVLKGCQFTMIPPEDARRTP